MSLPHKQVLGKNFTLGCAENSKATSRLTGTECYDQLMGDWENHSLSYLPPTHLAGKEFPHPRTRDCVACLHSLETSTPIHLCLCPHYAFNLAGLASSLLHT